MNNDTRALETFAIRKTDLQKLTSEALRSGGSYCDLFFENTMVSNLMLRDGEVSSGGYSVDYGCGIRVLDGEKTGYAYSESTDMPSLLDAARAASAIATGSGNSRFATPFSAAKPDFYPMQTDWRTADAATFLPGLNKLEALIRAKDSRVMKMIALLGYSVSEILMYNSLGELTSDLRPIASLSVQVVYQSKGSVQTKSASRSFRMGVEFFTDELIREVADEATSGVDAMFEARRPAGGQAHRPADADHRSHFTAMRRRRYPPCADKQLSAFQNHVDAGFLRHRQRQQIRPLPGAVRRQRHVQKRCLL